MRKMKLFTIAAIMALALAAVGCGGKIEESNSMLSIVIEDEKVCEVELSDTGEDSSVSSAALVIADGEALVIEPSLEEGDKVLIQMKSGAENESIDAVPDMSNPDYEITVEGNEAMQYSLNPGSYRVNVLPEKGTNGRLMRLLKLAQRQRLLRLAQQKATQTGQKLQLLRKRRRVQGLIPWQT